VVRSLTEPSKPEQVALIEHDSYCRSLDGMTPEQRDAVNFDHPDALETTLLNFTFHLKRAKS
jgi:uridine kinase